MKPGTPGFIGERLRVAHAARGVSAASLAAAIGVSRATITQYESGRQSPSPRVARLLSEALRLPIHHFLRPIQVGDPGVVFYRSLSSATKAARTRAEHLYLWFREIVAYLRRYVKFPMVNLPDFHMPDDCPSRVTHAQIEQMATETRRSWGIGDVPVGNMALLLERNGAIVARHKLDSEKLDAFSEWNRTDATPYIVLNSEKGSAARSRFDAGHEVAHLVLHRNVSEVTLNTPAMFSLMEDQANRFSAALLLPEDPFSADLHSVSLDLLRVLKAKWRVSVGVMIKRAYELGFISDNEERRLWITYGRRGWRKHEPLDDEQVPEEPRYVRRSIEVLVEKGVVPREALPAHLALPATDIEQLVGLPSGFFQSGEPKIELHNAPGPDVIPFPER